MKRGDRIGADFRLVARLGSRLWQAERASNGERVAIKLAGRDARWAEGRRRFVEEARAAEAIESEHVVETLGFGVTDDGVPYLVMEWLEGETLAERLGGDRVLAPGPAMSMLAQVASALDAAHAAGTAHGALVPENVFLVDGDAQRVKLLGFALTSGSEASRSSDLLALGRLAHITLRGDREGPSAHLPAELAAVLDRACSAPPPHLHATELTDALERALEPTPSASATWADWVLLAGAAAAALALGALLAARDGL